MRHFRPDIEKEEALCFDDVSIKTGLSTVNSRSEVDLTYPLPKDYSLETPIFTAAMDTITSYEMAGEILALGGAVVHHRNQDWFHRLDLLASHRQCINRHPSSINGVAVGTNIDAQQVYAAIKGGADLIALEVAHAYNEKVLQAVERIGKVCQEKSTLLMVGNFSSIEGVRWLREQVDDLVDIVKVSQGGGSCCSTRLCAGIGKPTFQSVYDLSEYDNFDYEVVACGGIKSSGDLAKAIGAGAFAGMLGNMLAGTDECPGQIIEINGRKKKLFRGMASKQAKGSNKNVEGISTYVDYKGPVRDVVEDICHGVRSGIASAGYEKLENFSGNAKFLRMSTMSKFESIPHAKDQ